MNSSSSPHSSGGVVTTQNISTVIRPRSNNNSLQFVKIQTPELSKTAVEQIRIAEDSKISKDKIKEVEEEWQNNLLNWKSKRRQHFSHSVETETNNPYDNNDGGSGRKVKTFAEMVEQRARSGNRLGFHLQRYIGADDDSEVDPVEENGDTKVFDNNQEPLGKRLDSSDCEVLSSTSSGYIQPDSKSPSSPETPLEIQRDIDYTRPSEPPALNCDNSPSDLQSNQSDTIKNGCISIIESAGPDQLNSTLRKDIIPPDPFHSDMSNRMLDVDYKTNELTSKNYDSDNSAFEDEDDNEEDEEKQQQRIAFVNKLKVFENLTKPTSRAPKFVAPKRTAKPVPRPEAVNTPVTKDYNPIVLSSNRKSDAKVNQQSYPESKASRPESSSDSSIDTSSPDMKSEGSLGDTVINDKHDYRISKMAKQIAQIKEVAPLARNGPSNGAVPKNLTRVDVNSSLSTRNHHITPSPQILSIDAGGRDPRTESLHSLSSRMNNLDLSKVPTPRAQVRQTSTNYLTTSSNRVRDSADSTPPTTQNQELSMKPPILSGGVKLDNLDNRQASQFNLSQNYQDVGEPQSKMSPKPIQQSLMKNSPDQLTSVRGYNSNHVGDNIVTKPAPPMDSSPKRTPNIKKPISHEDKDRTVLSVSGKRRCSSCKEELGRGAAAFVVESLNLVYHTNCFRCSVCHVNLSNGFRGVDVRVHAGALHCQNCYSKDGLNYSRV